MLLHYGIERGDLDEWLYLWAPKKLKLMAMKQGSPQLGELEGMLRHIIKDRGIGLWGLDPFVKTHAVPENDNGAMDIVCETLASIAIDLNCAGDIPHHTSKGIKTPGDAQSGRGASSTVNAGRLVYTLNQMSPDEAKLLGTPEGERRSFIRVDSGKVNIAPHSREAKWFRLVGVPLENGNATYPNGDNVQTVVPWLPPKMWEGTDDAVLNRILDAIDAGLENGQRYSDAPKTGADRAAWRVVQRHLADKAEPLCREIIKAWVRAGVLVSDSYHDPVERKDRKGLSVDPSKRPGAPCVGERDYEVTPIEEHG